MRKLLSSLLLFFLLSSSVLSLGNDKQLVVCSEQNYPPFALGLTDATADGFTVELWRAVAIEMQLDSIIRVKPFHNILQDFRNGMCDVLINLAESDARRQFADFTVPHVIVNGAIFVRRGESLHSEADLNDKRIIVLNGDLAHDYALSKGWEKQLVLVDNAEAGFQLLASGQQDVMLLSKLAGQQILNLSTIDNITALPIKVGFAQRFSFAVQKGNADLLAKINEGLALTKANGTYNKLYEKWFGIYEEKSLLLLLIKYLVPIVSLFLFIISIGLYRHSVERQRAMRILQESETHYRNTFDRAPIGVVNVSLDGRFMAVNSTYCDIIGYSREELLTMTVMDVTQACDKTSHKALMQQLLAGEIKSINLEKQYVHKDRSLVWGSLSIQLSYRADGSPDYFIATIEDINKRKAIEQQLNILSVAIEQSPLSVVITDADIKLLYVNPRFVEVTGYSAEEALGKNPNILQSGLTIPDTYQQLWGTLNQGNIWHGELVNRRKNGEIYWEDTHIAPVKNALGITTHYVGINLDITERKMVEKKLAESESIMATVLENVSAYIFLKDTKGRYTFASRLCLDLWDLPLEKVIGVTDEDLFDSQMAAIIRENDHRVLVNGESIAQEESGKTIKTGKTATYWAVKIPLRHADGGIYRLCGISTDITARKEMDEDLRSSKAKLEAALASMTDAVFISDTEGRFIEFNEAFANFHKFKNKDECAKTLVEYPLFLDVYSSSGQLLPLEQWAVPRALRGETGTGVEFTLRRKDTGETWIGNYSYAPICDSNGVIVGSVVTARDITERKKAEALLRESEEKLRLFIHYSPSAIAMFDREMRYLAYSHRWLVNYGLGEQELTGRSHYEIFPNLPERWKECHRRSLAGVIEKCDRDSFPRADGSVEWIRWEIYPWLTSAGDIGGIILFIEVITERVKMEEALSASEKEFRLLAESMPQIVWITRADGESIYLNQQWVDYTGLSLEESYGHNWNKALHPDDQQRAWNAWQTAIHNKSSYSFECQIRRADGVYRWWLDRGVPVCDETGNIYKWFGTCTDIHELKESEKSLRIAAIAFESQEAMVITDAEQTILKVNQAFTRMTGYSAEEAVGNTPALLKSGKQDKQFYVTLWEALNRDKFWAGEIWNRRKNGELYIEWLSISAVTDANGQVSNYVAAFADISASKKLEETIHHLAFHDRLTKLPNRRLLIDRLQQALNSSTRHLNHGAILFIDLDNFKELNDIRGYEIGDLLLIEIAQRLQHCVCSNDMVACLGGDDFVILLEELSKETEQAAIQAESFAEKIHATLSRPFDLQEQHYHNTCSIGISLFCNHETSVDDLLKYADTAMYQAKKSGRNSIRFFDPATHAAMKERIALEFDLRLALPNQQFKLYYQMQVDNTGKILGAETLIRWHHPERGLVPPTQFIHLLEESGLIVGIGLWILETACTQIKRWELNDHTQHLQLAVNVSARQFSQADFVEQVRVVLAKTAINPNRLKLELTESLTLEDVSGTILKIQTLKDIGVHFSMDDFGTGYSSLSYLSKLPMDQLKIDQSFVCNIGVKPSDAVIVQTIIGMAKNLDMEVIAEGVETEQQRDFLERNGCTHYQGYLFSKPLPLEEFEQLLRGRVS